MYNLSKITDKERTVIRYKTTGKPMKVFEDEVGNQAGITMGYANNLFQRAKKKTGLNSSQIIILARTTNIFL